jgi:PAS domain S-box-containing protein
LIIIELIYNLALLVAVSTISGFINNRYSRKSLKGKVLQGLLFGLTAVLGMMYPFRLFDGVIFDGRSVILTLCGLFFGPVAAIISGVLALIYRISLGGPGWIMGVLVISESVLIGLIFFHFRKKLGEEFGNNTLILMGLVSSIIMLFSMLGLPSNLRWVTFKTLSVSVLFIYPLATLLIGKILIDQEKNTQLIDELSESESNFKSYIKYAPDAVFVVDAQGKYLVSNPAATRITGYTEEEINQKNVIDFITKEDTEWAKNHFNTVVNNGYSYGESKFTRKDGSIGWWSVEAVKINDNRFLGFSKDITEKKNNELKIEESLAKFQSIFELAPDAMVIASINDLKFVDINNSFVEISGFSRSELIGKSFLNDDFSFWLNPEQKNEFLNIVLERGIIRNFDADIYNRFGVVLHCYISASVISLNSNNYALIIISDQTQKKKTEDDLQKSAKKFRELIEQLPDGYYQSTPNGKFLFVNPAFVKMLGYSSKNELMAVDIIKTLYFAPEERVINLNSTLQFDSEFEIYKLRKKDGTAIWIEEHSKYIKDDTGRIVIHEGICRDITDRVRAEELSSELFNRIKKVSMHIPGFIYQYCLRPDGSSYFPFASEGIYEIYGISPEIAKNDVDILIPKIIHPEDFENIINSIAKSAQNLTLWQEEYRVIHNDGNIIWVEGRATPEKDNDGSVLWHGYISDITARKLNEAILKESEISLQTSQEIAGIGSWEFNFGTNKLKWSKNYFTLLGYEPFSFEPNMSIFYNRVFSEDKEFVIEKITHFYKTPIRTEFEFRILLDDGKVRWILNSIIPIFKKDELTAIHGTILDITERKHYEDDLRKLTRAIEQNPLAVVITNLKGSIEYVNPKFTEITGYSKDDALKQNPKILKSGEMSDEFYEIMWNELINGNQWQGQILNKKKNGMLYWAYLQIAPVTNENNIVSHYIAISEDITEEIEIQKELIKAKNKAEESDRLKSAFLANMSHEIRTPMNGIIGFSRMLTEPDISVEDREEFVHLINFSCDRLINTVNDILDISKIEAKQMEVKISEFMIDNLMNELYETHLFRFKEKGLYLINKCENLPNQISIISDEQKVFQILNNLLTNAYKFIELGGVEFGYKIIDDTNLEFYVTDTGVGIPEENLELIFGRFNQGDSSLTRAFEGTGLGLSICKGLAEILNGDIFVESEFAKGSTFKFILPMR